MLKPLLSIFLLFLVAQPLVVHPRILRSTNAHFIHQNHESNIQKGDETSELVSVAKARKYLKAFGYLESDKVDFNDTRDMKTNDEMFDEMFYENLEAPIKKFQEFYNLKVSGKLDSETMKLMSNPRCGVADVGTIVPSKFALSDWKPKWLKTHLTYTFDPLGVKIAPIDVLRSIFNLAFKQWSRVSTFTFEEVSNNGTDSDLIVGFYSGDHGDGFPFDKYGPSLAHAFAPMDGRLHVNADKPWSTSDPIESGYYDLVWVAMHEIGHLLGLDHSSHDNAVMYAYVNIGENRRKLSDDDIAKINRLYSSSGFGNYSQCPAVRLLFSAMFTFWYYSLLVFLFCKYF
ncbi:metalloendoproteinase 1-MMP-like [Abrus precatorius]|uniref:Metalloendoproteinase 1-MMP-like n=1 Tax=Abrus precatorius TaxID=3816 RepID=A0A8B8K573_ABRPR|nr:metalloendoproteinase 1-MMP-like [Abrus precatorius]